MPQLFIYYLMPQLLQTFDLGIDIRIVISTFLYDAYNC